MDQLAQFVKVLEKYFTNLTNITISDVRSINEGWETEIHLFTMQAYDQIGQWIQKRLVSRGYFGRSAEQKAGGEFKVMNYLAQVGYPVPKVFFSDVEDGLLGKPVLVMEQIDGQMLGSFLLSNPQKLEDYLRCFVRLYHSLHALPWGPIAQHNAQLSTLNSKSFVFSKIKNYTKLAREHQALTLEPLLSWLRGRLDKIQNLDLSLLHKDYHPNNLLITPEEELFVIDWGNVEVGDYRFDLAWTTMLLLPEPFPQLNKRITQLYEEFQGHPISDLAYFQVLAGVKRLLEGIRFIQNKSDMNPGALAKIKESLTHFKSVSDHCFETAGLEGASFALFLEEIFNS